jgi:hypothetical protein
MPGPNAEHCDYCSSTHKPECRQTEERDWCDNFWCHPYQSMSWLRYRDKVLGLPDPLDGLRKEKKDAGA